MNDNIKKSPSILSSALKLLLITSIAGLLISATYMLTKAPVENQQKLAADSSRALVLPDCEFTEIMYMENNQIIVADGYTAEFFGNYPGIIQVTAGHRDGEFIGYAVEIAAKGYGGDISLMVGAYPDATISGMRVGANSETPGLGAKIELPEFYENFDGLKYRETDNVQAITGATVSSEAVKFTVAEVQELVLQLESGEQAAEQNLQTQVLPDCEFTDVMYYDNNVIVTTDGYSKEIFEKYPDIVHVYAGHKNGEFIGYAIEVSAKGYGGNMTVMVGAYPDATLSGIRVGDNSETPGLGTKVELPEFYEKFEGVKYNETHNVQAITGATGSSETVKKAVETAQELILQLESGEQAAEQTLQAQVLPDCEFTDIMYYDNNDIVTSDGYSKDVFEKYPDIVRVHAGHNNGEFIGYAVEIAAHGYGGDMTVVVGVYPDATVSGMRVGANSETPGLGTKIELPEFYESFDGLKYRETGKVQAITGATVSVNAVISAVETAQEMALDLEHQGGR